MKVDSIPREGMGGTPYNGTRKGYLVCQKWSIGGLGVHIRLRGGVSLYKPLSSQFPRIRLRTNGLEKKQRKEDKLTLQGANESLAIFSTIALSNLWKHLSSVFTFFSPSNSFLRKFYFLVNKLIKPRPYYVMITLIPQIPMDFQITLNFDVTVH